MFAELKQKAMELWSKRPGFLRGRSLYISGGAAAVVLLIGWSLMNGKSDADPYRTAAVDRGAITRVVSATGTLQPLVSANVGATVSGPVSEVLVDFNSQVRAGQVLARLDPTPFQQRIVQAQAQLAQQQAQLAVAQSDYQRYVLLQQRGFASEQLMAQQRAARDTARAAVASGAAQVATARTDLERSVIRSPIEGVVVDRQVNVGQPVAASLQAATLFVIAQDLSRLQANITVDEADIGEVNEGQAVQFTVDAFPDREFEGVVSQVRQQGVAESGVVSYTVVVEADNPGRQLLPGMTANAEIVLEQREDVLRVPNTALRFRPADPELVARGQALVSGGGERRERSGEAVAQTRGERGQGGEGRRAGGGQGRGRVVAQLAESLQLNEQQRAAAQTAFENAMATMPARGQGGGGDRRAAMRRMRDQVIQAIEPTLTAQQRELLTQVRSGAGPRQEVRNQAIVWVLRNNKPAPVLVEIGVADNGYTLLHSGLNEGDEVIIGGGPRAEEENSSSPFGGGGRGGGPGGGVRIRGG
ncbi:efflux RND transporter periplasmic adaptor subunit [Terricaulis silvestris]|uniref:Macrolide-specific efflux protein MacA n=1 Tax=Terricaulis silvestris TaxID=2686094 RepID=A0A6I6MLK2_9CAUL|nr:efflux RND transporter periplasmic adaptor subunit [Terricaulis silvestris]QGZ96100.1 Macrolide-specific efflux protein MacA precursor [Terricaulis silvestris]